MKFKAGTVDDGDICSRFFIPLDDKITIKELFDRTRPLVAEHILKTVDAVEAGTLTPEPQDESRVILSFPRLPEDGEIDWYDSAADIDRLIRTVTRPYPGAFTFFRGRKMFIWKARVLRHPPRFAGVPGHVVHIDGRIGVLTGEGILMPEECQFDGEDSCFEPEGVFRTHRLRLGMNHSKHIYDLRKRVEYLERELAELKLKNKQQAAVT